MKGEVGDKYDRRCRTRVQKEYNDDCATFVILYENRGTIDWLMFPSIRISKRLSYGIVLSLL